MNELANVRCDGEGLRELALFAGAGGGILGGHLLGWRTVCAVEWEPYAACVLAARQNDGILPAFPVWDDVQTFDGKPWAGRVDVISGGFPCQDISAAGRGAGIEGKRSGMWGHMARIIGEVRPRFVYVENSPMLTSRGLHRVLGDLAEMGFDAQWGVVSAADVGAPHKRDRIWILANANGLLQLQQERVEQNKRGWIGDCRGEMADANSIGWRERSQERRKFCDEERANYVGDCGDKVDNANGTQCKGIQFTERTRAQHSDAGCASWWSLNPDWVEWLMNWPIKWSDLNGFDKQEFQRWKEASAKVVQESGEMRTLWWDSDPSEAPSRQQPSKQSEIQHSDSLSEVSRDASCEREMEGSHKRSNLFVLQSNIYISEGKRENLQPRMREQTCMDETQIVPRVVEKLVARVDRLKAIGNGQVPLVAATAWNLLK